VAFSLIPPHHQVPWPPSFDPSVATSSMELSTCRTMSPTRRSVCSTSRRPFVKLWLSTNLIRFGRLLMVVWPPSLMYFESFYNFFISVFVYELTDCFLSLFTLVLVFESLQLNIFYKSLSLVTPVLWQPCLKPLGSHLRKHCPRILSFLILILSCPTLV
jgi:hypothetical protein